MKRHFRDQFELVAFVEVRAPRKSSELSVQVL